MGRYNEQGRKWCAKCRRWLETACFYKNSRNADGLQDYCQNCRAVYNANRTRYALAADSANKKAKRLGVEGRLSPADVQGVYAACEHRCQHCGASGDDAVLSLDHIVPLSLRGLNIPALLQILCVPCNSSKGKSVRDYRHTRPDDGD